jgi:hypothetical protein
MDVKDEMKSPTEPRDGRHRHRPSGRDDRAVGSRATAAGRGKLGCERLAQPVGSVGDESDAAHRRGDVAGGVDRTDAEGCRLARWEKPDLRPRSRVVVTKQIREEPRGGRDLEAHLIALVVDRGRIVAGAGKARRRVREECHARRVIEAVPIVGGGHRSARADGKRDIVREPLPARSTIPAASLQTKGAVVVGMAPPVVDQPTARPRLSIPAAQELVVSGSTPGSMAVSRDRKR